MRFSCPRCHTSYQLATGQLPTPRASDQRVVRRMRCVRCQCIFSLSIDVVRVSAEELQQTRDNVYFELLDPKKARRLPFAIEELDDAAGQASLRYQVRDDVTSVPPPPDQVVARPSMWSESTTLDLADYEEHRLVRRRKARSRGWLTAVLLLLGVVVFVIVRNDFAVDAAHLDRAVKRAFGLLSPEERAQIARERLVVVLHGGTPLRKGRGKAAVVTGTVQNDGDQPVHALMLRGELRDPQGGLVMSQHVPCSDFVTARRVRKMARKRLEERVHAQPGCSVASGDSVPFSMVFYDLPKDFAYRRYVFRVVPAELQVGASPAPVEAPR